MSKRNRESFFNKWERVIKGDAMTTPPKDAIRVKAEASVMDWYGRRADKVGDPYEADAPAEDAAHLADLIDSALRALAAEKEEQFRMERKQTADMIEEHNRMMEEHRSTLAEKDMEIAELEAKAHQLHVTLALMHFAGVKVKCCWYSPNVFDRSYSAGAIQRSATCDCGPCTDWRNAKHSAKEG